MIHFEVLVEDRSGSITVDGLLEKIFGANGASHSWNVHRYQGIGRLPKDLRESTGRGKRLLLNVLPRLLRGYGRGLRPRNRSKSFQVFRDGVRSLAGTA